MEHKMTIAPAATTTRRVPDARDVSPLRLVPTLLRSARWAAGVLVLALLAGLALLPPTPAEAQTPPSPPSFDGVTFRVFYSTVPHRRPNSGDWQLRLGLVRGVLEGATTNAAVGSCGTGTDREVGWYASDARTTPLAVATVGALGSIRLSFTPTMAGEYLPLAYCKSGTTYSTAVNLMGSNGKVTMVEPSLTAGSVTRTGATLATVDYGVAWWYKRVRPTAGACTSRSITQQTAALTGLTAGTTYLYRAYRRSGCGAGDVFGFARFTTFATADATLTADAGSITKTGATLRIANHTGGWWYKRTAPTAGTCTSRTSTQPTAALTGLTAGTTYTYKAYSATGCNAADEIASATVTTAGRALAAQPSTTAVALSIGDYTAAWWYRQTDPSTGTCTSVAAGDTSATVTGLTANTTYTYKAYSATGCNAADEIKTATAIFTTRADPTLTSGNITRTGARLTIADYEAAWWYKRTAPTAGACTRRTSAQPTATLTGLTASTTYTYKAYQASGCNAADEVASETFTTVGTTLTSGNITQTGARLTIGGRTAAWWYRKTSPAPAGTCTSVNAGTTYVDLTGLTAGTSYTYKAYSASGCGTANELASASFVGGGPHAPGNLRATTHRDRLGVWVVLHWDRVPGATAYNFRYRAQGGEWGLWYAAWNGRERTDCRWPCHHVWSVNPSTTYEFQMRASRYNHRERRREWTSVPGATVSATTGTAGTSDPGDGPPAAVSLSAAPNPVDEGLPVTVTATLSKALSSRVTIPLAVTPVTAEARDYGALASVTIAGGSTTGTALMTTGMDADGDDETFRVGLDTANLPSSVTAGDAASTTVTITDTGTGAAESLVLFPNPPATVRADPGDRQAVLSWSAVEGASGWEYRQGSGAWTATGSHATTHTVTGLTNGTAYTFKVRATSFNGLIKGTASAGATVTAGLPSAPDAVASVRVSHRGTSLGVTWDAPARATHYDVGFSGDGGATWTEAASSRAGTGLTISGTAGTKSYTVRVRARNAGGESVWTSSASVPYAAPAAPASVSVTHDGTSLAVSWGAPARAESYAVAYSGDGGATWTEAASSRAGTGLTISGTAGTKSYTVRVRARNAGGESVWTSSASVPYAAPAAPASVSVTHDGTSLAVSWGAPARAESYAVAYSADGGGTWATATPKQTGTRLTISGVDGATTYTVRVRARNAAGSSGWTRSAPVASAAPDAVASVSVTHNGSSLAVTWAAPARATHYDVTYYGGGVNARAAWSRAGTSLTITCDVRPGHENQSCVSGGTAYTVGVRARNAAGESAWTSSGPASHTPAAAPDAVASVSVVHKGSSLAVSWEAPARATHYDVTYTDANDIAWQRAAWNRAGAGITITANVDGGAAIDSTKTYLVGVRARNAAGESAWTNSASAAVPAPDRAEIWFVTPGAGKVDVYVVRPARTASYEVRTKTGGGGDCGAGTWGAAAAASHVHVPEFEADRLTVTGLAGGTAYCVQVRAANANGAKGAWSAAVTAATPESALSVADATVSEPGAGQTATLDFVVTLAPASSATVTVDYATADGTAAKGSDYTETKGTLTFTAGETAKTVAVPVLADSLDDGGETLTLTLSNASGATLSDSQATGTITNDGPMPKAWTARFGRTVADQVLGAVEARMQAGREPGAEVSLAGERLGLGPRFGAESGDNAALKRAEARREAEAVAAAERLAAWLAGEEEDTAGLESRTVSGRELLVGSSFALTAQTAGGGSAAVWGRGAVTRFDGREGETSLDGEVTTGMLGADWSLGRTTAGLVVGHSRGEGGYRGATGGGTVSSTLTGLWPWGRVAVSERVTAWGAAGFGEGTLELTPESADGTRQAVLRADLDLAMGAAGLRGTLLDGGGEGLTLAAKTDALAVRTSSGRGRGADGGTLAASQATVTRLRLGLEARRPIGLGDPGAGSGATLTPSFETAVRHDGGDAETGFGLDLGGGLALSAPASGLEAELRARGLLTHEAGGFRERGLSGALHWRQRPGSDRGATLSLTQTVGASASGGADALFSRTTLDGLAANDAGGAGDDLAARRLEARLGYGLPAFGGRFTLTPEAGAGLADTGRDVRLGLRLTPAADAGAFELILEAARREAANDDAAPVHDLRLGLTARF